MPIGKPVFVIPTGKEIPGMPPTLPGLVLRMKVGTPPIQVPVVIVIATPIANTPTPSAGYGLRAAIPSLTRGATGRGTPAALDRWN